MQIQTTQRKPLNSTPMVANKPPASATTEQAVSDSFTFSGSEEPSKLRGVVVGTALAGVAAGAAGLAFGSTGWAGGAAGAVTGLAVGGGLGAVGAWKVVPDGVGAGPAFAKAAFAGLGGIAGAALGAAGGAWVGASIGNPVAGIAAGVITAAATGYAILKD
jgi:hypothetical protein